MSMISYSVAKIKRLLKVDFIRFCIVGGSGFIINLTILTSLHKGLGITLVVSQLIGAEVALFSNFVLHHRWTYKNRNHQKNILNLIVQFHVVSWPAIIGSTVMVSFGVIVLKLSDLIALVFSSVIALLWNFVWSKYVVWRDIKPDKISSIVDSNEHSSK